MTSIVRAMAVFSWFGRAGIKGGKFRRVCDEKVAELLPKILAKNRNNFNCTDDNCYLGRVSARLIIPFY